MEVKVGVVVAVETRRINIRGGAASRLIVRIRAIASDIALIVRRGRELVDEMHRQPVSDGLRRGCLAQLERRSRKAAGRCPSRKRPVVAPQIHFRHLALVNGRLTEGRDVLPQRNRDVRHANCQRRLNPAIRGIKDWRLDQGTIERTIADL